MAREYAIQCFIPAADVSWTHSGGRPSAAIILQEMTLLCDGQLQLERLQQNLRLNQLTGNNWLTQHTVRPPDSTPEGPHARISCHRHGTTHASYFSVPVELASLAPVAMTYICSLPFRLIPSSE